MKIIISILLLIICTFSMFGQEASILKGKINSIALRKVYIKSEENPLTGTRDEFIGKISDSISFIIEAKLTTTQFFNLFINDELLPLPFLLIPGKKLVFELDSGGFRYQGEAEDYYQWADSLNMYCFNNYSVSNLKTQSATNDSTDKIINEIFKIKDQNILKLNEIKKRYSLSEGEFNFAKYKITYLLYTTIYSNLVFDLNYSINSKYFEFLNNLPLNDLNAANQSIDYNRALEVFTFYKLRLENKWYNSDSIDYNSDEYAKKYYDKIFSLIKNEEIRNILITRNVCQSIDYGATSADYLYNRYKKDCTNNNLKNLVDEYYKKYLSVKESNVPQFRIDTLNIALSEKIKEKKGKVVYLDFWASSCSFCIHDIPFSKKLSEKYANQPFEVVYVNIDDNIGSFKTTAKKLGLSGTLIYLNHLESKAVRKFFKMDGIPHYALIDKNGLITYLKAPGPKSIELANKIDQLLNQ